MSRTPDLLATLRSLPLFAECTDDELTAIDSMADQLTVPSGRTLVREGEAGREFIVIVEGSAAVERGGVRVATLGDGDHVGELALFDDQPRDATVTALSDLRIEVIDRRSFQALLDESPHLTKNLLAATARRLHALDAEVAELRARLDG